MQEIVEPEIVINGVKMNLRQSMTIRVALESFATDMLKPNAMGNSENGITMARLYAECIDTIRPALYKNQPK